MSFVHENDETLPLDMGNFSIIHYCPQKTCCLNNYSIYGDNVDYSTAYKVGMMTIFKSR